MKRRRRMTTMTQCTAYHLCLTSYTAPEVSVGLSWSRSIYCWQSCVWEPQVYTAGHCSHWISSAEQCPSLLVCLILIPPILPCCLYNESGWISFKNLIKKYPKPNLHLKKYGFGFWLSFLRCWNSCHKASTSLLICADLSWTQLIYEIYPKQSWLTRKVLFFFFFSTSWELNYWGWKGFGCLVFSWFYSIFMRIGSRHKYCEFLSRCKF